MDDGSKRGGLIANGEYFLPAYLTEVGSKGVFERYFLKMEL